MAYREQSDVEFGDQRCIVAPFPNVGEAVWASLQPDQPLRQREGHRHRGLDLHRVRELPVAAHAPQRHAVDPGPAVGGHGEDGMFERFQLDYDFTDAVTLTGGVIFYQSGDQGALSGIEDNDRAFFELSYEF